MKKTDKNQTTQKTQGPLIKGPTPREIELEKNLRLLTENNKEFLHNLLCGVRVEDDNDYVLQSLFMQSLLSTLKTIDAFKESDFDKKQEQEYKRHQLPNRKDRYIHFQNKFFKNMDAVPSTQEGWEGKYKQLNDELKGLGLSIPNDLLVFLKNNYVPENKTSTYHYIKK